MMPPLGLAFSLNFCCPLIQFALPSVSLFGRFYKLVWVNDLRSDYPLNSASVEWRRLGLRPRRLILWARSCLSLTCCGQRTVQSSVWVDCPGDFAANADWHTKNGVHALVFADIGGVGHRCLKRTFAGLALHGPCLLSTP